MDEPTPWTRVDVTVPADRAELVADHLWSFGPAAIEEQPDHGRTRLLAGYADPLVAAAAAADLEAHDLGSPTVAAVTDHGLDGWRDWARPAVAGPFLVVPTWLAGGAAVGADLDGWTIRLDIDPGHTFGSGSHVTSRLVLARLAELVRVGERVLDVGCGSGILAVGAALLGAAAVEAIDVDPEAPDATRANARTNGVDQVVRASGRSLADVVAPLGSGPTFDVVAANLLAPIVIELAPLLARAVAPGGALVVSGLLAERWEPAVAAVADAAPPTRPLSVDDVATADGWVAVTLRAS